VPPQVHARTDGGAQASTSGAEDGIRAAEKRVPNYKRHLMERRFLKITRGALHSGVRVSCPSVISCILVTGSPFFFEIKPVHRCCHCCKEVAPSTCRVCSVAYIRSHWRSGGALPRNYSVDTLTSISFSKSAHLKDELI
jgi:hypothetical protein